MYVEPNFKTKKALREALAKGERVLLRQPGFGPSPDTFIGVTSVEGPHYPEPHRWYARVRARNGVVLEVVS